MSTSATNSAGNAGPGASADTGLSSALSTVSVPVPDEILREIFVHALGLDPAAELDNIYAYKDGDAIIKRNAHRAVLPFRLAGVSRSWRRVALHTAELWTWLSFGPHSHGMLIIRLSYLRAMISRSRYAPLDVFIDVCPSLRDVWAAAADVVCSALIGAAARWRFICVQMPPVSNLASAAALLGCTAPILQASVVGHSHSSSCSRWSDYRRSSGPGMGPITLRLASSKLRSIELSQCTLEGVVLARATTCPSLVSVSLAEVKLRVETLWELLSSAGSLQILCLAGVRRVHSGPAWRPSPTARLRLPHLRELYYSSPDYPEILPEWAPHLDLPRVEYLHVDDVDASELLALAPCLRDSLRRLCHFYDGDEDLIPVLAALPHLREVDLSPNGGIPDAALLRAMADGAILPELEALIFYRAELTWYVGPDDSDPRWILDHADDARVAARALLDFAKARNSPGIQESLETSGGIQTSRLKRVQFDYSTLEMEFVHALEDLVTVKLM